MCKLVIKNLYVNSGDKQILKGINLEVNKGETHVIMGINGSGKSTLLNVIMGDSNYQIIKGDISFNNENILNLSVDERARKGIFMAFQNPFEIPGITNSEFIKEALQSRSNKRINLFSFIEEYEENSKKLKMDKDFPHRDVNLGFSGGEKKRNEILQMLMLKPKLALLDEIDSGLDFDAIDLVGKNIKDEIEKGMSCILITHQQRIIDYLNPDYVHIINDGKIIKTGDKTLANKINEKGFKWLQ